MSSSASEVVRTTTGMDRSSGSPLTSSSTSRPSLRGRLRSSSTRSGRGADAWWPSRRRNLIASSPSFTTCRLFLTLLSSKASLVSSTSPGSSSTSSTSIGRGLSFIVHVSGVGWVRRVVGRGAGLSVARLGRGSLVGYGFRRGAFTAFSARASARCHGRGGAGLGIGLGIDLGSGLDRGLDRGVGLVVGLGERGCAGRKRPADRGARRPPELLIGVGGLLDVEPDPAAVILDDLLAHRESDARTGVLVLRVQPLEDQEDPVGVAGIDADAVVGAGELPHLAVEPRPDVHVGRLLAPELDRVADEVLE